MEEKERRYGEPRSDAERAISHYGITYSEYYSNPEKFPLPPRGAGFERGTAAIETPKVKYARYMHRDDGKAPVVCCLYEDGVITSCVGEIKDKKVEWETCYSSKPGMEASFFPWIAHLSAAGYKERAIEAEGD